jgi:hypothetical protein
MVAEQPRRGPRTAGTAAPVKRHVDVAAPVLDRLQARQRALSDAKHRWVTLDEMLEGMLDELDRREAS